MSALKTSPNNKSPRMREELRLDVSLEVNSRPRKIWTDGACFPNPGSGGWSWISDEGKSESGSLAQTTNQVMELTAVVRAIESNLDAESLLIISDSKYVIDGATSWTKKWVANNWKTANGSPVKHQELWGKLVVLSQEIQIQFQWVRGHSGDLMNEKADELANRAAGIAAGYNPFKKFKKRKVA